MIGSEKSKLKLATAIGTLPLIIWSLEATIVSEIKALPIFQTMTIIFSISFIFTVIRVSKNKRWHQIKQPPMVWLVGFLGLCCADSLYICAFKFAPEAHIDLIDYLWPFLVILFAACLPKEKLSQKHLIGAVIAVFGIYLLITNDCGTRQFWQMCPEYMLGYMLALAGAAMWAIYTVYTSVCHNTPSEMSGIVHGIGAITCLILHLVFEQTTALSMYQLLVCLFIGLFPVCIANQVWDYAIKRGCIKFLSMLNYFTPFLSMGMLVLTGKEPFSGSLVVACFFVTIGVIISSVNWRSQGLLVRVTKPLILRDE